MIKEYEIFMKKNYFALFILMILFLTIYSFPGCIENGEDKPKNNNNNDKIKQNQLPILETIDEIYSPNGDEVIFNVTAYDLDGWIMKYEYDFNNDGIIDWSSSNTGNTTYIYYSDGIYLVNFSVTDNEGAKNYTIIKVYIFHKMLLPDPELLITFPSNNQTVSGTINITGTAHVEHYTDEIVDIKIIIEIKNDTREVEFSPNIYTEDTYDYFWYYILDTTFFINGQYKLIIYLDTDFIFKKEIQIEISN